MAEYDDQEYQRLIVQLQDTVAGILDMDGNDEKLVRQEVDNAIENAGGDNG